MINRVEIILAWGVQHHRAIMLALIFNLIAVFNGPSTAFAVSQSDGSQQKTCISELADQRAELSLMQISDSGIPAHTREYPLPKSGLRYTGIFVQAKKNGKTADGEMQVRGLPLIDVQFENIRIRRMNASDDADKIWSELNRSEMKNMFPNTDDELFSPQGIHYPTLMVLSLQLCTSAQTGNKLVVLNETYLIEDMSTHEIVGVTGAAFFSDKNEYRTARGIFVRYRKQNYGRRSMIALANGLRDRKDHAHIVANVEKSNVASIRNCLSAGMVKDDARSAADNEFDWFIWPER